MDSTKDIKICIDSFNYSNRKDRRQIRLIRKICDNHGLVCYVNDITDEDSWNESSTIGRDEIHPYLFIECKEHDLDFIDGVCAALDITWSIHS